jgi:hypothetical protein
MRDRCRDSTDFNFRRGIAAQARHFPTRVHEILSWTGQDGINDWFAARHERNELSGYLEDIRIANELAERSCDAESIGLLTRYSLFDGVMHDVANHLPASLLVRLVEAGTFTGEQAITWSKLATEANVRFDLFTEILRMSKATVLAEEWIDAIETGANISDADRKVQGLARRALDLPVHLRRRLLSAIESEPNEGSRSGALQELSMQDGLDDATLEEMWRLAVSIRQDNLRPNAMIAVGSRMHSERQQIALDTYTKHLEDELSRRWEDGRFKDDFGAHSRLDHGAELLARYPLSLLESRRASARTRAEFELVNGAIWIAESVDHPLELFERVCSCEEVVPEIVWERLCVAFLSEGRTHDAVFCALAISDERSEHRRSALAQVLARIDLRDIDELIPAFVSFQEESRIKLLTETAAHDYANVTVLKRLAALGESEREKAYYLGSIAARLTQTELDQLLEVARDWPKLNEHIAPYLSHTQTLQALSDLEDSFFSHDALAFLLKRLVDFDDLDTILKVFDHPSSSLYHKEVIAVLVPVWPGGQLLSLFRAVRPVEITKDAVMLRATLNRHIPGSSVRHLIAQLLEGRTEPEMLEDLASLATIRKGADDQEHLMQLLISTLRNCLPDIEIPRTGNAIESAFRELAKLGDDLLRPEFLEEIYAAIVEHGVEATDQVNWLTRIGAGPADDPCRLVAWRAAFEQTAVSRSAECLDMLAGRLRKADEPLLSKIITESRDHVMLLNLTLVGSWSSQIIADDLALWTANFADVQDRMALYSNVLPAVSQEVGEQVLTIEKSSNQIADPNWWVQCIRALLGLLSDEASSQKFRNEFEEFEASRKVALAWTLLQSSSPPPWIVDWVFQKYLQAEFEDAEVVLSQMAPFLTSDQIDQIYEWGLQKENRDLRLFSILAKAALSLGNDTLAIRCALAAPDSFSKADILKDLVERLSQEGLDEVFWLARRKSQWEFDLDNPVFETELLSKLARRAMSLGDLDLFRGFRQLKQGSSSGGDVSLGETLVAAPAEQFEAALEIAKADASIERPEAISALLASRPEKTTMALLTTVIDDVIRHRWFPSKVEELLKRPLRELSATDVAKLFLRGIRGVADHGRGKVLDMITLFEDALISKFGAELAVTLDAACAIGCTRKWP